MSNVDYLLKQKYSNEIPDGFSLIWEKYFQKINFENGIVESLTEDEIDNFEKELYQNIKNINLENKNLLVGLGNYMGSVRYYEEKNDKFSELMLGLSIVCATNFGIGFHCDITKYNTINCSIYKNNENEYFVKFNTDFLLITNDKYNAKKLNYKKEKLDVVATGRIYPKYKKLIDKHNINVGQLIMEAIDKLKLK